MGVEWEPISIGVAFGFTTQRKPKRNDIQAGRRQPFLESPDQSNAPQDRHIQIHVAMAWGRLWSESSASEHGLDASQERSEQRQIFSEFTTWDTRTATPPGALSSLSLLLAHDLLLACTLAILDRQGWERRGAKVIDRLAADLKGASQLEVDAGVRRVLARRICAQRCFAQIT